MGGISVIAAANSAVAVFGRALALELAPIRVNVVAPGLIEDTSIWSSQSDSERSDLSKWGGFCSTCRTLRATRRSRPSRLSLIDQPLYDRCGFTPWKTVELFCELLQGR
jgi:NAD(P)-dependent dehydrogenase (short-subunit alcohol dehydrogenase family)